MDTIIVYLDDAAHARQQLRRLPPAAAGGQRRHWILVACPPRMTRHLSKWVNHTSRQNWRNKWLDKLYPHISPGLRAGGDRVTEVVAEGPLAELSQRLQTEFGVAHIVDARRPKFSDEAPPGAMLAGHEAHPQVAAQRYSAAGRGANL